MKKILIEVSAGELIDKLTILEIKLEKISSPTSLKEIESEFSMLKKLAPELQKNENLKKQYEKLKIVNKMKKFAEFV